MGTMTVLRGMTWSDPRGYDPLVAVSAEFNRRHPDVRIEWEKRSLQGFESTPVETLAAEFDLLIIDHPHVGDVARQGCLLPLESWIPEETLAGLANETVGKSFASYSLDGHQWALPVDAAAQVQAHRPDRGAPVETWDEVRQAAQDGLVILPLRPPHSLMSLFTLAANIGEPCGSERTRLLAPDVLEHVLSELKAVTDHVDRECFGMDPVAALDRLSEDDALCLAPLTYLYKGYANAGYREHRLCFTDIPALGKSGPIGSTLGGTGLAVSSRTAAPELCTAFAAMVAGAECQAGLYAASNGQPANARAWASAEVNAPVLDAYRNTRLSHEAAWLRPRHHGYMPFQENASQILNAALLGRTAIAEATASLNDLYAASFAKEPPE